MIERQVLSVAYDISLLTSRQAVLESGGHAVQSASDLQDALDLLSHRHFALVMIGSDLPLHHQSAIFKYARQTESKVLLLTSTPTDTQIDADCKVDPFDGPYVLLERTAELLGTSKRPAKSTRAAAGGTRGIA